jgi:hypothetical protein
LLQDPGEKRYSDVASVWVRQAEAEIAADHELVLGACVRPPEAEPSQARDKLTPRHRRKRRHHAGCLMMMAI